MVNSSHRLRPSALREEVALVLHAESLRGSRKTFIVRMVIGVFGVASCLAVQSANTAEATRAGVSIGLFYVAFAALGLLLLRRGKSQPWLSYAGAASDASVVSLMSMTSLYNHSGAYETLLAPIFCVLYVMFVIITGLQYSVALSVFAALTAALERGVLLAWIVRSGRVETSDTAVYGARVIALVDQYAIIAFIAFSGVLAAWVAHAARQLLEKAAIDSVRKLELERRQLRFKRYLSSPALEHVLDNPEHRDHVGERHTAAVLVVGLGGLGMVAEDLEPEAAVALLNQNLGILTEIVLRYGGALDKFTVDGLIAVFGLPYAVPDPAGAAVRAAVEIQDRFQKKDDGHVTTNLQDGVAIGIAHGMVIAANVGSRERMEYAILGPALTRAQRLQASSSRFGPVLVDESVHDAIRGLYSTQCLAPGSVVGLNAPVYVVEPPKRVVGDTGTTLVSAR
jgi:class 3 adenylate cyclase